MSKHRNIKSALTADRGQSQRNTRHRLPLCAATGLARYRGRHQARDGASARAKNEPQSKTNTFACVECRGFHLETIHPPLLSPVMGPAEPVEVFIRSLSSRKRRYMLVDIENLTGGAMRTPTDVAGLWQVIREQAPGIAPHDHVVVGAARRVSRKYRHRVAGPNVKWVLGADAPDGADHALLAAIDLRRVAAVYDELVIMSGDHAFTELAHRARRLGLSVHVVTVETSSGRPALSKSLEAAAHTRTLVRLRSRGQVLRNNGIVCTVADASGRAAIRAA